MAVYPQAVLRAGVFLPLRGYDRAGRAVILIRPGKVEPATMAAEDCYKVFIMVFALVLEGNTQANTRGLVLVGTLAQ